MCAWRILRAATLHSKRHLSTIVALPGLKLKSKSVYLRALDLYATEQYLDFVDALNVAHMERIDLTTIVSFDRDFDRASGVMRVEP